MGAKWWKKISKSSSEYGVGKKNFKKKNKLKKSPFHMQPLDLGIRKLILIWHCPI
jgi:hypothetical protein